MKTPKFLSSALDFIFTNTKFAWFWLFVRLYLGYEWAYAGYEKIINPVWVGAKSGVAMSGFVKGALAKTAAALPIGSHPDVSNWYAWFLQHAVQPYPVAWSYAISYGELLVGLGLILGAFTFLAAFFGFFMNLNYLFAGTVSVNPQLLILALLLMFAHKTAGYFGFDNYVLKKGRS